MLFEMQVLQGSNRVLADFSPNILYENIAGSHGSNNKVAEYLTKKGYQLFQYQPYAKVLKLIKSTEALPEMLNIIAIHQD